MDVVIGFINARDPWRGVQRAAAERPLKPADKSDRVIPASCELQETHSLLRPTGTLANQVAQLGPTTTYPLISTPVFFFST